MQTKRKSNKTRTSVWKIAILLVLWAFVIMQPAFAHTRSTSTFAFTDAGELRSVLESFDEADQDIDEIEAGPDGEWIIVSGTQIFASAQLPAGLLSKVTQFVQSGRTIDAIAIADNGSWVVAAEDWYWRSANVPLSNKLLKVVKQHQSKGRRIDDITFTPAGGFVVFSQGRYHGQRVPSRLWRAVKDSNRSKRRLRHVSIDSKDRWIVVADQWYASAGLSNTQRSRLNSWQRNATSLNHTALGPGLSYVMYSHETNVTPSGVAGSLEYGLKASNGGTRNIWQRLNDLGIPGLSLAVIENKRIKFARAYGVLEAGTDRWAATNSPYPVASLSKYVTALGVMRMIEEGHFTLGTNIRRVALSEPGILRNWQSWYQNNGFAQLPVGGDSNGDGSPDSITVRRLLNHRAGINGNCSPGSARCGVPAGGWNGGFGVGTQFNDDVSALPTIWILDGWGCNGNGTSCGFLNNDRIWVDPALGPPGTRAVYSNAGYEVLRGVMEQFGNGDNFSKIMKTLVFEPLNMNDSTYVQPLPNSFESRAAEHHDSGGNPRSRRSYQWVAGGGLYASAHDYAKSMLVLIDTDTTHNSGFLSPLSTLLMSVDGSSNDGLRYGFGVFLRDNGQTLMHDGRLTNQIRSWMEMRPSDGRGIVVLVSATTNSVGANGKDPSTTLLDELLQAWRDHY